MTDETKKHAHEETKTEADGFDEVKEAVDAALGEEVSSSDAEGDAAPDNAEALAVLVDGLKRENVELKDRHLRVAAEMENLRRRTERDVRDAKSYAIAGFARDMLAVSDNLRRALEAVTAEQRAAGDSGLNGLIEGVEVTERAMLGALERHGVRKQEPEGQKFDPNFHQAMFEVPNADVPNHTVVQVVQDGYVIGDRVLRPAMVGVAKGGGKQAADPQPAEGEPSEADQNEPADIGPEQPNGATEK